MRLASVMAGLLRSGSTGAIAVTHQQQTRSLELRAMTGLSRLWQQHGKAEIAGQQVSPRYHFGVAMAFTLILRELSVIGDSRATVVGNRGRT